jgi:hypothetical protein
MSKIINGPFFRGRFVSWALHLSSSIVRCPSSHPTLLFPRPLKFPRRKNCRGSARHFVRDSVARFEALGKTTLNSNKVQIFCSILAPTHHDGIRGKHFDGHTPRQASFAARPSVLTILKVVHRIHSKLHLIWASKHPHQPVRTRM